MGKKSDEYLEQDQPPIGIREEEYYSYPEEMNPGEHKEYLDDLFRSFILGEG